MKINKILDAVKNIDQVYEGVKNKIWKKEYVELIAADRYKTCKECDQFDVKGSNCTVPGTQPCCSGCGCSLALKTRALSSACPIGKWDQIMNEADEDALNNNIE